MLTKILKEFKTRTIEELKNMGKGDVDIELCPILHRGDNLTAPINAEMLNR